ncbi:XdhC family protein [Gordoniibacillus kamchatkensis]|uniref:XdhC family protein n=1 Tax=Gordoniibacillus kamchatkensis TaxID=1590651 RepID=UPI000698C532|nr:XdhC family protein [Paenibacillus sp. VKM B-2647]
MLGGETPSPQLLAYDMREEDDAGWGRGAGCNGIVHILLEKVDERMRRHYGEVRKCLDDRIPVTVVKAVQGESAGDYLFVAGEEGEGRLFGKWRGAADDALLCMARGCSDSGLQPEAGLFMHRMRPKPRLFLFGAAPDARPLAALAARTGFSVTVSDWRPAYCTKEHFPGADELLLGFPDEVMSRLSFGADDCVVVMTHDFQRDKELLSRLRPTQLLYLGVMGSKQRTSRLLEERPALDGVKSPVGLPIGAQGPEEIAVSVVADLIRHVRLP